MEIVRTVGSGLKNRIVINKPGIAEVHAEITYATGHLMMVEDLGSPAGTYVNNRRIQGKKILKSGDILSFGEHVFPFEEHYPEMLKTQTEGSTLDSGPDDGEPEEVRAKNDEHQEEVLSGLSGIKRWIYALQFPKERQKLQRLWILVVASVMLLSIVLPWLSWSNPSNATIVNDDTFEALSGIGMFLDMLEVEVSGTPLMYIALYGVYMLTFLGTITAIICYFLIGAKVWIPHNLLAVRRISQVVLVLFGINFFLQFLRYVWYWLDGDNALVVPERLVGSAVSESRVFIEYMGLGYWICGFAILLVLRSTRNGLWQPRFNRKWTPLSLTFWMPYVLLLFMVHQGLGLVQTSIDEDYSSTGSFNSFFRRQELKERIVQNGPNLADKSYIFLISELKIDEVGREKLGKRVLGDVNKRKAQKIISFIIWMSLHGIFIVSLLLMFRKRIRGTTTFILSSMLFACTTVLVILLYLIVDMEPEQEGIEVSMGYGTFFALAAAGALLGEQFYFWTKRNDKQAVIETSNTLDDLV
ncbi:MAG: FHA domain-containing protein [bacterium]|nr:FHA domain-containing protein [bacterium]